MGIQKPCLNCKTLIDVKENRCNRCLSQWNRLHPKPYRPHYAGDYPKRAAEIRANATQCWICKEGARPNDPWTADHLIPSDPNSPLAPAHRSCNSSRGNRK